MIFSWAAFTLQKLLHFQLPGVKIPLEAIKIFVNDASKTLSSIFSVYYIIFQFNRNVFDYARLYTSVQRHAMIIERYN